MSRAIRIAALAALAAFAATGALLATGSDPATGGDQPGNNILAHQVDIETGTAEAGKLPGVSGGVMQAVTAHLAGPSIAGAGGGKGGAFGMGKKGSATQGCSNVFKGTGGIPDNIRVNQDCSLRRQAEEVVVANPASLKAKDANLIAGQNDSRVGFNHCGYDWSFDGGKTWGDQIPPFYQFLFDNFETADACSDPTATWDSQSNAFVGGVLFEVASAASAVVVAKSNAPIGGRFYHSPFPLSFQEYRDVPLGVPASDDDPDIFHDKEFIVADWYPASPKVDDVYVTWTRFELTGFGVGIRSPIVFSRSTDGGATWSDPVIISGSSAALCTDFSGSADPDACDQDQGSHPIVGPDGTIYVAFGNGNTPDLGINQVLFVSCPPAEDCEDEADWTPPVKVGDLIGTHPIGDAGNVGGCPTGRQCLPPNGYRVPEFTSISTSIDAAGRLYVSWADFRNGDDGGSTCGPLIAWSAATPPCNNDVFYAYSLDDGGTWSPTATITTPFGETAQWQPWSEVAPDGTLMVAFYDRQYGGCEFSGCNDITLAAVSSAATATPTMQFARITTASMPNLVPANNPLQAGFLGDYMWIDVAKTDKKDRDQLHIVWADTRNYRDADTPEEDVYYATMEWNSKEGKLKK